MKIIATILFFLFSCNALIAQVPSDTTVVYVFGWVTNKLGEPLEGVLVKSTTTLRSITTDSNGNFDIEISPADKLQFSKKGIRTETIDPLKSDYRRGKHMEIRWTADTDAPILMTSPAPPPPPPPPSAAPSIEPEPLERLKTFPNPYPSPSGIHNLHPDVFKNARSLGDVDKIISTALGKLNYDEKRYYYFPPYGFALVTKMEQTNPEGISLPAPGRWSATIQQNINNPIDYIKALLTAPQGYYRIFVFLISAKTTTSSGKTISENAALKWLDEGYISLPAELKDIAITNNYNYSLLVYQYRKTGSNSVMINNISAKANFEKSKLSLYLSPQR